MNFPQPPTILLHPPDGTSLALAVVALIGAQYLIRQYLGLWPLLIATLILLVVIEWQIWIINYHFWQRRHVQFPFPPKYDQTAGSILFLLRASEVLLVMSAALIEGFIKLRAVFASKRGGRDIVWDIHPKDYSNCSPRLRLAAGK